jgi:serine protease AprX
MRKRRSAGMSTEGISLKDRVNVHGRRFHSDRGRTLFALATAFIFLALPASAIDIPRELPASTGLLAPPRPDTVIDKPLSWELDRKGIYESLEIIVQFEKSIRPEDRQVMENLNIRNMHEFRVLPAVYASGTKESILMLAKYPRTIWMENNTKMELLMNGTTTTINATTVWNSEIVYKGGFTRTPIDGTGVTVALVDTGCDAGHPDLDYGRKVIINLKSDQDLSYTEVQDSDTGSGHGTHCAGTILGNGDASAGARTGVAPGISTGEHFLQNVLGALEWVYEHSQPGNNPYNIRACSNSWGGGPGEYDPSDSISQVAQKLTYENNVVVVFAAGNSGADDHDGSHIETSNYGNTPSIVEVAAALHEGDGMAYFSSRGDATKNHTWPDIAAPGYKIWATEARGTQITAMVKKGSPTVDAPDAYYMAISGTSMATPHVSGAVALLFQAAPSLRVMDDMHEEYNGDDPSWWNRTDTRIHEAEYILEMTANYMKNESTNGVPDNCTNASSHEGHSDDYAQGFGLINTSRAVQVCLILEEMRRTDTRASVLDAWHAYQNASGLAVKRDTKKPASTLITNWKGEWGYLLDNRNTLTTKHARKVFIPDNITKLKIDLNYDSAIGDQKTIGELTVCVDSNGDGSIDWRGQGGFVNSGWKHDEVDPSSIGTVGTVWDFYIEGNFIRPPGNDVKNPFTNQYREILVEYTMGIEAKFDIPPGGTVNVSEVDLHAAYAQWQWGGADTNSTPSYISMPRYFFDFSRLVPAKKHVAPPSKQEIPGWLLGLVAAVALGAIGFFVWKQRQKRPAPGQEPIPVKAMTVPAKTTDEGK